MKKKIGLLLLAGLLIFIAYVLIVFAFLTFRSYTAPKMVEVKEADFLKLIQSRQIVPGSMAIAELEGSGGTSYTVIGSYKNPHPPGDEIRFSTPWVKGSDAGLLALTNKYDHDSPPPPPPKLSFARRIIRLLPFTLFLMIAWYLFRREIASLFGKRA